MLQNDIIRQYNQELEKLADEKGWGFVDISQPLADENGDLAVEYCEKAVEIRRRLMSEEHLDFINSLNSLAALCCKDIVDYSSTVTVFITCGSNGLSE